jgi:hypothetical protein
MHFTRKPPTLLASTKTIYRRLSDIEFSAISPRKKKAKMDQAYILYEKLVDRVQKGRAGDIWAPKEKVTTRIESYNRSSFYVKRY